MPKFLDAPSWYNSSGSETIGRGEIVITTSTSNNEFQLCNDFPDDCNILFDVNHSGSITFRISSSNTPTITVTTYPTNVPILVRKRRKSNSTYPGVIYEFTNMSLQQVITSSNTFIAGVSQGQVCVLSAANPSTATSTNMWTYGNPTVGNINGKSLYAGPIYAPVSSGTDGYILTSNGSGAPSWTSKFSFEMVAVPSSVWDDIDVTDTVVATTTVMSIHMIFCTFLTGATMFLFPIRSTSTATITNFSGVVSLVYGNNHMAGASGNYNGRIIYGVECSGPTSFYLHCVA